ncbi:MAG: hypothetical protein ACLQUY_25340 [Ktedonobacterales bacterium]
MPSLPYGFLIVGFVALMLMLLAAFMLGARFGTRLDLRRASQTNQLDRSALLRQGLRLQATITNIRSSRGGTYVTTAAATDLATGEMKTYTQRTAAVLGHRGDPITILVDPTRPNVYLMVRSIG